MHRHKLWNQKKEFGHVFLFVHIDTWMIPKRIESICNLVISCNEISIITMASRYFQIWSNIEQNYKKFFLRSDRLKLFFLKLFSLEFYRRKLFFFFRLVFFFGIRFYFISGNRFCSLPKAFVVCDVTSIKITEEVPLSAANQAYSEIALFITCLSNNITF